MFSCFCLTKDFVTSFQPETGIANFLRLKVLVCKMLLNHESTELLTQRECEVLQHLPYNPDLAASDFHFSGPLFIWQKTAFLVQENLQNTALDYELTTVEIE